MNDDVAAVLERLFVERADDPYHLALVVSPEHLLLRWERAIETSEDVVATHLVAELARVARENAALRTLVDELIVSRTYFVAMQRARARQRS